MNEVRGFSAENKGLEQQARLSDVKSGVEEAKKLSLMPTFLKKSEFWRTKICRI